MKLATWADLEELKVGNQWLLVFKFDDIHTQGLSMAVNLLGAVADVLIAAVLFYFLHKSRTGFRK